MISHIFFEKNSGLGDYWKNFNNENIKKYIFNLIQNTIERDIIKKWKNFYIYNKIDNIRITVNSFTYRIITVDKINI